MARAPVPTPRRPASCWSYKRRYPTAFAAEKALKALSYRFGYRDPTLGVYPCPGCGAWHLGRQREDG